jgi:hypothetical protein
LDDPLDQMGVLDASLVYEALRRLSAARPAVFGANAHHWMQNEVLFKHEVVAFEQLHRVSLPFDYRHFLTNIGDGGVGPFYGVFPLGQMDDTGSNPLKPWREGDGFVGILSEPFPLREPWNDLSGKPANELLDSNEEEYERQLDLFETGYWDSSRMNGAIPICHMGCALRIWLVITGDEAGHLWRDGRAEDAGLSPLSTNDDLRLTFSVWYRNWLEESLRMLR